MDNPRGTRLTVGDWQVDLAANEISKPGSSQRLDPRLMRLLVCLADRPGQITSTEVLLKQVWNEVIVTPDSVYQAIASLRRALGDDPKKPTYIETVPRVGYRLIATVAPPDAPASIHIDNARAKDIPGKQTLPLRTAFAIGALVAVILAALATFLIMSHRRSNTTAETVAVLPFLDLTSESMDQEYFADGLTEELIDRLSQIPGLQVASASTSFYYKNQKLPVPAIGKALRVHYLLDGSLRKSGDQVRIAARLLRAEDGFVIWTQTYEREAKDPVQAQDAIADEVVKTLRTTIHIGSTAAHP